jgi:hypothetical protein
MRLIRTRTLTAGLGTAALATVVTGVALASTPSLAAASIPASAVTGATASGSSGSGEGGTENEHCERPLPAEVVGAPDVDAGAASGYRIWHDDDGWHLRVTHPGTASVVFTGSVHSGQPISWHAYRLEPQDTVTTSADHRTVTFRLVNHGRLDGIDLTDRCAIHTGFELYRAGSRVPVSDVWLGKRGAHPAAVPFTELRRPA